MQRLAVYTALGALAVASGCATPWQKIQTKHVTLYTDSEFGHEEVLRSLEQGRAMLASSFFANTPLPDRVDVLFVDDVPFNSLMGPLRSGAALAKAPGSSGIGVDGLLILRPLISGSTAEVNYNASSSFMANAGQGGLRQQNNITGDGGIAGSGISANDRRTAEGNVAGRTAVEMLAHLFLQKGMPNAPLWFREGFANYARQARYNMAGGNAIACFGFTPIVKGTDVLLDPDKLWGATWELYGGEYRSWLPYSGQMTVDYMIHGDNGAYRDKLGPFVTVIAEGKASPEALNASFGWNDAAFGTKLKEHVQAVKQLNGNTQARGPCPLGFRVAANELPDTSPPQKSDADAQKIAELIAAIEKLPEREGYQEYYPIEVIDRAGKKR